MTAARRDAAIVTACLLAVVVHAVAYDAISDDAFIILRYAENLVAGHGLVFNVGDRVEGYTSTAFTLAVAAATALGIDPLFAARGLALLSTLGIVVVCARLARAVLAREGPLAPAAALIVAASAPVAVWSRAGLETTAYALAVAAATLAMATPRTSRGRIGAALLLALTSLLRPEGTLVAAVLCAVALAFERRSWRAQLPLVAIFATLKASHLLARRAYYGDWLPNTYYVKAADGGLEQLVRGAGYVLSFARDNGSLPLWLLPLSAAAWRRDRAWWTVASVWLTLVGGVVWVGGDGLFMYRFLVPTVALWAVLLVALVADAVALAGRVRPGWLGSSATGGAAATVVPLVVVGLAALAGAFPERDHVEYERFVEQRDWEIPTWTEVGRHLAATTAPGASVACVPIGAIGYYSKLPLFDMLGLTDRHIARRRMPDLGLPAAAHWTGHAKHDGAYILEQKRPTHVLLGNVRVLDQALAPSSAEFFWDNPAVQIREDDVLAATNIDEYAPHVDRLASGRYLHYLRRE